jgi:ATP-binding cassette subfamily C protein
VFSLIERFYDPEAGVVTLDGRDLAEWDLPQLRSAIGYVEQDAPVLSGSLRENLLLGNPDADADAVARVLKTTRLDGLVAKLPSGLETLVGYRGPSCRVVSGNGWRSHGRCCGGLGCCCWTRPRPSWTR